jgi:hypothetical protein
MLRSTARRTSTPPNHPYIQFQPSRSCLGRPSPFCTQGRGCDPVGRTGLVTRFRPLILSEAPPVRAGRSLNRHSSRYQGYGIGRSSPPTVPTDARNSPHPGLNRNPAWPFPKYRLDGVPLSPRPPDTRMIQFRRGMLFG